MNMWTAISHVGADSVRSLTSIVIGKTTQRRAGVITACMYACIRLVGRSWIGLRSPDQWKIIRGRAGAREAFFLPLGDGDISCLKSSSDPVGGESGMTTAIGSMAAALEKMRWLRSSSSSF